MNKITDPFRLSDEEIDNLCVFTGTYPKDADEGTKQQWRKLYRIVEAQSNAQIEKAGSVEAWYESGEGRLL